MSATSMNREAREIADGYSWDLDDLHDVARNGIYSAFIDDDEQEDIYRSQIKEVYDRL
jgi:adenosine deaminase